MSDNERRTALVIGGASGIGEATARKLAEEGATTFLTSRRNGDAEAAAERIGSLAVGLVADASDPDDLARVIAEVADRQGGIDALVLNAGISEPAALGDTTPAFVERHFAVNVGGAVAAMRAAAPFIRDGGSVVIIGSIADVIGSPIYGTYAATKAALRSYARSWAAELAPRSIRVNVVSPGPTDTAMFTSVSDEDRAAFTSRIPLGRMAKPLEVATAATFLLSSGASFITGAELCVDGGMTQV